MLVYLLYIPRGDNAGISLHQIKSVNVETRCRNAGADKLLLFTMVP